MSNNDALETTNFSFIGDLRAYLDGLESKSKAADKAPFPFRATIVKDDYDDLNDRFAHTM
mgnify:FL=1